MPAHEPASAAADAAASRRHGPPEPATPEPEAEASRHGRPGQPRGACGRAVSPRSPQFSPHPQPSEPTFPRTPSSLTTRSPGSIRMKLLRTGRQPRSIAVPSKPSRFLGLDQEITVGQGGLLLETQLRHRLHPLDRARRGTGLDLRASSSARRRAITASACSRARS